MNGPFRANDLHGALSPGLRPGLTETALHAEFEIGKLFRRDYLHRNCFSFFAGIDFYPKIADVEDRFKVINPFLMK